MGVISDAIDSLQEWCENLFKDGIKSQFDSISDLMTETFHKTTEDGGLISTFLTGHPASFSGSASGGTTIWSTIETLCNNVVVPIGGFILVIILLNDLIQTVIRGNNFKDFDDSVFIKWIIKALCGVIWPCEKISVNSTTVIKNDIVERLEKQPLNFFTVYNKYRNLSSFSNGQPVCRGT